MIFPYSGDLQLSTAGVRQPFLHDDTSAPERLPRFAQGLLPREPDVAEQMAVAGEIGKRVAFARASHPQRYRAKARRTLRGAARCAGGAATRPAMEIAVVVDIDELLAA
jgi:hypothetical protein